jgi:S-adenosyl methyltransferase
VADLRLRRAYARLYSRQPGKKMPVAGAAIGDQVSGERLRPILQASTSATRKIVANMSSVPEQTQPGSAETAARLRGLDTSVAHPARVYDYLLGGCFL